MSDRKQKLLFVCRHSPYGQNQAKEGLDAILTAAAFEQPLSVLFMDDGIWQLLKDQDPRVNGDKNLGNNLSALPLYDVESIYIDQRSLTARGLDTDELLLPVTPLHPEQIQQLLAEHDHILSF